MTWHKLCGRNWPGSNRDRLDALHACQMLTFLGNHSVQWSTADFRWDEKAGLRRDALSSQVVDALKGA